MEWGRFSKPKWAANKCFFAFCLIFPKGIRQTCSHNSLPTRMAIWHLGVSRAPCVCPNDIDLYVCIYIYMIYIKPISEAANIDARQIMVIHLFWDHHLATGHHPKKCHDSRNIGTLYLYIYNTMTIILYIYFNILYMYINNIYTYIHNINK